MDLAGDRDGDNGPVIILDDTSSTGDLWETDEIIERNIDVDRSEENATSNHPSPPAHEEDESEEITEQSNGNTCDSKDHGISDHQSPPTEVSWIHKGADLNVVDGKKKIPYQAKTVSDPFFSDKAWMVRIKWDGYNKPVTVECSRCAPIDLTMDDADIPIGFSTKRPVRQAAVKQKRLLSKKLRSADEPTTYHLKSVARMPKQENLDHDDDCPTESSWKSPLAHLARMPSQRDSDNDDNSWTYPPQFVSPSPVKKAGYASVAMVQGEKCRLDSDDESIEDKKPAARVIVKNALEDTDSEDERKDDVVRKRLAKKKETKMDQFRRKRTNESYQIVEGMEIRKTFDDGVEYRGTVTHGEGFDVMKNGRNVKVWRVKYEDSDSEDLEEHELHRYRHPRPVTVKKGSIVTEEFSPIDSDKNSGDIHKYTARMKEQTAFQDTDSEEESEDLLERKRIAKQYARQAEQFERGKEALCRMEVSPEEAEEGLRAVGPPYDKLQEAMKEIAKNRGRPNKPFRIFEGMEIRKPFNGDEGKGFVSHGDGVMATKDGIHVKVWNVLYEDGDEEDLEEHELLRYRYPPPKPQPCRGRQMQFLELFCGRAVVSQEFRQRQWKVASIDILDQSNATLKKDILEVDAKDLDFVPDCIWASPPCHTYSNMAGGHHRSIKTGEYEKTEEARNHNFLFTKMVEIMRWAKAKHPHLIVVIENPVGSLSKMPLMDHFRKKFMLHEVKVDYCTFGRSEKKPTMIWTNDFGLSDSLRQFNCKEKCLVGGNGRHESVQSNGHIYDYCVIPQALAEEVAAYVDARFIIDRRRRTEASSPGSSFTVSGEGN